MNKTIKKTISISLVAAMLLPNLVQAGDKPFVFGDQVQYGHYGAGYVGEVYDGDPNSIAYSVGGKYTLKRRINPPVAWFHASSPSVEAGCGGISMKGSFLTLLNLDQISEQLKDAGAAFAWGVMLGIVTSLPSIKEVFQTINDWATTIQKMLTNACNLGKIAFQSTSVGKKMQIGKTKAEGYISDSAEMLKFDQESMGNAMSKIGSLFGTGDAASAVSDKEGLASSTMNFIEQAFKYQSFGSSFVSKQVNESKLGLKDLISGSIEAKALTVMDEPNFLKTNPSGYNPVETTNYQWSAMGVIIISNLIGDTYWSAAAQKNVNEAFNLFKKGIKPAGLSDSEQKELGAAIKTLSTSFQDGKDFVQQSSPTPNAFSTVLEWAKDGNNTDILDFTVPHLSYYVYAYNGATASVVSNKTTMAATLVPSKKVKDTDWKSLFQTTGGFKALAMDQVACVKDNASLSGKTCSDLPPVPFGNSMDYLKTFSQSTTVDQYWSEGILTDMIEVEYYIALIDVLKSAAESAMVPGSIANPTAKTSADTALTKPAGSGKVIEDKKEMLKLLISEFEKVVVNKRDSMTAAMDVDKVFRDLNTKNRKRAMEKVGR